MAGVDMIEYNPFEAVTTNVLGTRHVIETTIDAGVERVLLTEKRHSGRPRQHDGDDQAARGEACMRTVAIGWYGTRDADPLNVSVRFVF